MSRFVVTVDSRGLARARNPAIAVSPLVRTFLDADPDLTDASHLTLPDGTFVQLQDAQRAAVAPLARLGFMKRSRDRRTSPHSAARDTAALVCLREALDSLGFEHESEEVDIVCERLRERLWQDAYACPPSPDDAVVELIWRKARLLASARRPAHVRVETFLRDARQSLGYALADTVYRDLVSRFFIGYAFANICPLSIRRAIEGTLERDELERAFSIPADASGLAVPLAQVNQRRPKRACTTHTGGTRTRRSP